MDWVEVFAVLVVSHLVGDFVLQTDWQAVNKHGGLRAGNAVGRSALGHHLATYLLAFVPALVWLATEHGWATLAIAAGIGVPHGVQDDGRLLALYMRRVKGSDPRKLPIVALGLDQALHLVALLVLALVVGDAR